MPLAKELDAKLRALLVKFRVLLSEYRALFAELRALLVEITNQRITHLVGLYYSLQHVRRLLLLASLMRYSYVTCHVSNIR